mgnify:CR=1 FL=1
MPPPGFNDRVWDMPVRVTHWVLAATALGAYFVPAVPLNAHAFLGYAALTAVAIRIAWGFVGSEYARFTNFVPGMRALIAYLPARYGCIIAPVSLGVFLVVAGLTAPREVRNG